MNITVLFGHVGQTKPLRFSADGTAFFNFTLATNFYYKDKDGNSQQKTTWFKILCKGRLAEWAGEKLKSGSPVLVRGHIENKEYTNKDGVTKRWDEIVVSEINFMSHLEKKDSKDEQKPDDLPGDIPEDIKDLI